MSAHPALTLTDTEGDRLELTYESNGEVVIMVVESDLSASVVLTPTQQRILAAALGGNA